MGTAMPACRLRTVILQGGSELRFLASTGRFDHETAKGYRLESYAEAFSRFLPPSESVTTSQVNVEAGYRNFQKVTREVDVTDSNSPKLTASSQAGWRGTR